MKFVPLRTKYIEDGVCHKRSPPPLNHFRMRGTFSQDRITDATTIPATAFNITFFADALLAVGVDDEDPVLVLLAVDVDPDVPVEDVAGIPLEDAADMVPVEESVAVVLAEPVDVALVDTGDATDCLGVKGERHVPRRTVPLYTHNGV